MADCYWNSVSLSAKIRCKAISSRAGEELYLQLPHWGKRYIYNAENLKRSLIPNRVGVEHRPPEADLKQEPGHLETDTIFGKVQKSLLLTLVDKALKTVIIRKLPNQHAETVVATFRNIEASASLKP